MREEIVIRKALPADIPHIQNIALETWHDTYDDLIPREVQDKFLAEAYSDERMPGRIERTSLFVAEENGEVVGFANFFFKNPQQAELGAVYIYPQAQGRKIGSRLLRAGIQEKNSLEKIYVEVEKENYAGMAFYYAKGFELLEEFEEELFGHKLQTTRMVLHL
ncbi:GNAT family N-acetyltransferase [Alkalicoccus halolimnae]|uniref:GNAT family N-acetyltransferase n=1 Tax=Alkalicoccus halolimnae TaxID=1667239 RepID=A0A5C7FFU4_9BACI|nr:GNAT family N-acetyltransferase [Alkalicoccus halolimnae]TXF83309.1 GNAT family N-acetyltransferase [Alkalicoccus halolimnae]